MATPYNTGNPLGSMDPKDLGDNSSNLDTALNGNGIKWTDRFGVQRRTFHDIETEVTNAVLGGQATAVALATLYDTIAQGRAAVVTGASFRVKGAGDIAASEYRKTGETTQELLATYYSKEYVERISLRAAPFATEAEGRAAVTNGETFLVQGSGDSAAVLYRRTSAGASTVITRYASTLELSAAKAQLLTYSTEAAGRSAVRDGEVFRVRGSGDVAAYEYRKVDSTTSELQALYFSAVALDRVSQRLAPFASFEEGVVGVKDGETFTALNGNRNAYVQHLRLASNITSPVAAFPAPSAAASPAEVSRIDERLMQLIGAAGTGVAISNLVGFDRDEITGVERAFVGESGKIVGQIAGDSFQVATPPEALNVQTGLRADLCHLMCVSQSWGGGTGGVPAKTTAPRDGIVMFVGGVRPKDVLAAPDCYASLVPAVESNNAGNVRGETPLSGFARGLADAMQDNYNVALVDSGSSLLISVVGPGGQPLGVFTKGGIYWTEIVEQINAGYARAQAMGGTYRLTCCPVILGKGDYDLGQPSQLGFKLTLAALVDDLNEYVKALVPGHPDVPFIAIQTGSHGHAGRLPTIDLALNELDRSHHNVIVGATLSAYPRAATDSVHFSAAAYFDVGYASGRMAARWLFSGAKPNGMLPVEIDVQGSVISLRYRPPALPLVLDSVAAGNPINSGFELLDSLGNPRTITSVSVRHDRVVIVVSGAMPAGWQLRYACSGAYVAAQVSGPRGALRDSSANPNWGALFQITQNNY